MSYTRGFKKRLYDRAPYRLKNVMSSIYGWQQRRERYGEHYSRVLAQLRRDEHLATEMLRSRQLTAVRDFLIRAQRDSAFHSERFARLGFSPERMASFEDLQRLPVLSKEEVRNNAAAITSSRVHELRPRAMHTSGTTGKALHFPTSSYAFQREYAFRAHHYSWGGVSLDGRERLAFAFGHPVAAADRRSPPFWSYDYTNAWLLFSSYHMSDANLRAYVEELERFKPVMLAGYPSSLHLLAVAWRKWGRGRLALRAIFAASETLMDHQRRSIEEAFATKVFMWYGNTEMCANIVECERGSLHGRLEHSYVEVLDAKGDPAVEGRLICTALGNDAFPLVRYDVGDVVTRSTKTACECGRPGELFSRIVGRQEDYIVTPDGRYVGRLDHLFKDAKNVYEAQLVQRDRSTLTIRIVPRSEYADRDERQIRDEAINRLGPSITLNFEYVKELPRTSTGKFQFIVSSVKGSSLLGAS
jgi:phenylacetate-CoA ligase